MPVLETVYLGIAAVAALQKAGMLPEVGDIAGNLFADLIPGMTGRVVTALRGDTNHDLEKLLAATLVAAVEEVRTSTKEGGVGQIYWRDTQTSELAALRSRAQAIIRDPANAGAVKALVKALLIGESDQVQTAIRYLIEPLVDLKREKDWPVVSVDVAKAFFGKFNELYKSKDHVKGRLAFELSATRSLQADLATIQKGHADLAATLERILPTLEQTLSDCQRHGRASPLGDYDVRFDAIIGSLDTLRDDVAEGFRKTHESQREQIEGQRRLQEDVTAIHDKMEALQGNRRLVASNLPSLPGVAPRLPKQRDIEAALAACGQGTRIVVLHGLGGYGKSTLAMLHAINDTACSRYGNRRWIVSCENRRLEELLAELLVPSADTATLTVRERAEIVRTALPEEPSLVVLDNVTDAAQWQAFLDSGLLNGPSLDVIVTCREPLKRSVGGSVPIDRLAPEEIRELLGSRRPEICSPKHAEALATIERETEGMALLVAAVAAIIEDDEVDVDEYARSLEAMPLEALPAADEDGLPYPKRASEILADFHRRLSPALRRIAEYASLMVPDRIERRWLEWLLQHDSADTIAADHRIDLGANKAGHPRKPSAILDEAIRIDLLRVADASCFQFHRLHRKHVARAFRLEDASAHLISIDDFVGESWKQAASEADAHRFDAAIAGWNPIVTLLEGLRQAFFEAHQAWPVALRKNLASTYVNRGNCRQSQGRYADADVDYRQAIEIGEGLRTAFAGAQQAWPDALRYALANAYMNWGGSLESQGRSVEADAACGRAIEIGEGLRAAFAEVKQAWPVALQNDLASTYVNRGNSRLSQGRHADADVDYGQAIGIGEGLRAAFAEAHQAWPVALRNALAIAYMNRGNSRQAQVRYVEADTDYGKAIEIVEGVQVAFAEARQAWPADWQNDLAGAYLNRGNSRQSQGHYAEADADYERAIEVMEGLRRAFAEAQQAWPVALQHNRANGAMNRGNSRQSQGRFAEADADYGQAIGIGEGLRAAFAEARQSWPIALRNDLANAYVNRGNSRQSQGRFADADADYGQAIEIGEDVRVVLVEHHAWTKPHRTLLISAYVGRASCRRSLGDETAAAADERRARHLRAADDSGRPTPPGPAAGP